MVLFVRFIVFASLLVTGFTKPVHALNPMIVGEESEQEKKIREGRETPEEKAQREKEAEQIIDDYYADGKTKSIFLREAEAEGPLPPPVISNDPQVLQREGSFVPPNNRPPIVDGSMPKRYREIVTLPPNNKPPIVDGSMPKRYREIVDGALRLAGSETEVHTVRLTVFAVLGSMTIVTYHLLGLGGRQKAIAMVVPPELILSATGREGVRVPSHDDYSALEARELADLIASTAPGERQELISQFDPELVEYMLLLDFYVRTAEAQAMAEFCKNQECA